MDTELVAEAFQCRNCGCVVIKTKDMAMQEELCPYCDTPEVRKQLRQKVKLAIEEHERLCAYHRNLKPRFV